MTITDIRWKKRFENYKKAHHRLKSAAAFFEKNMGNDMELIATEALIKCFELSFELAWLSMKDFITYEGSARDIRGSRDSVRGALQFGLIDNGQIWIDMIDDRNHAAHVYDRIDVQQ